MPLRHSFSASGCCKHRLIIQSARCAIAVGICRYELSSDCVYYGFGATKSFTQNLPATAQQHQIVPTKLMHSRLEMADLGTIYHR